MAGRQPQEELPTASRPPLDDSLQRPGARLILGESCHEEVQEELYDHQNDPNEWHNLAAQARYRDVIAEHARHLPKRNVPPVPGSTGLGVAPEDRELFKVKN
jgi:hypothetical protein